MEKKLPILLTSKTAGEILDGRDSVSLDLGISRSKVRLDGKTVFFPHEVELTIQELKKIEKRSNAVYFLSKNGVFMIALTNNHFFKLVPTNGAPTIEIDGIRMHRTVDVTPEEDASLKIECLNISGGKILDTCTGLGYTSIKALNKGAEAIITVEKNVEVLNIASLNPYSQELFLGKIHKIIGDSYYTLNSFPANFFDYIIHDPPRFSHAGQLYGRVFYRKLFRAMKKGGKIFHYIGEPGSRYRNMNIRKGVSNRLRDSGFTNIEHRNDVKGIICEKLF